MIDAPPRWLSILGIGEDGIDGLSPRARAALSSARIVYGGKRHLCLAGGLIAGEARPWPSPIEAAIPAIVASRPDRVSVLASGDPFCFGIGSLLARHVPAGEIDCFPQSAAASLACARLGWAVQDTAIVSLCGRDAALLLPHLQPGAHVVVLSADASTPSVVARMLCDHGFGASALTVLEALGGPREAIRVTTASGFDLEGIQALNLVALDLVADHAARIIPLCNGLPDRLFAHDGQLTKSEIRAATLALLSPRQGELLWDVGCGAGSIGIEWMLSHQQNRAIGLEVSPVRAARARDNARALGVPGLDVRIGAAPDVLASLPPPDAVFIGGGARLPGVIDACWAALRQGGRLVVNAVTLETEAVLLDAWRRLGGGLTRLHVERLESMGGVHGFRPAITVTQWAARR